MPGEPANRPVRVLLLEDSENDQLLVSEMLRADGLICEVVPVKTRDDFENTLRGGGFDLIISDFSLPSFDGLNALALARKIAPQTPFIFFSGTIGEEVAVETLQNGATDYVLKQRPGRLLAAVHRALHTVRESARLQRTEDELRRVEDRLRIVARASDDVVWDWDLRNDRVWVSENFESVFGIARAEIGGRSENWQNLIHPDDRGRVVTGLAALLASGGRVWWSEHRLRRADGSWLHVFDRASVIYDDANKAVRLVGITMDMTERKQAEEKIREQAALLDKAQDAIIVLDADDRVTYWNRGAERIYGWTAAEMLGRNPKPCFFHNAEPPELAGLLKSLHERGEWVGELRELTKDGRQITVQARPTLLRDAQGRKRGVLVIKTDVTERKQLEEQFLRAQRLESLGALVGGIAHDLNNALLPILVGLEVLREEKLSEDTRSMVATMKTSARRGADMVQQMLLFVRGGDAGKTLVRADLLVKEIGRIVADTFPKTIQFRMKAGKDCWPVSGFPTRVYQVLLNLCVNARDAMPRGGTLSVSAANVTLTPAEAARHKGGRPGNFLCFTVADTGGGISADHLDKIFQPFFTTKAVGKGTGLGLSTCQSIVSSHDGFITVRSAPGAGAEFKVYLPAARGEPVEIADADKPPPPTGQGEHLLVVDDEEAIRVIARAALESYGYVAVTAGSGPEAVTRFAQDADHFRLVISDLSMPLMDGSATVTALRKIRPDLKVILTSGFGGEADSGLKQVKHDAFIAKPFTKEALLKAVHEVLLKK